MHDLAGQTLGKYRLVERIGKGGMSIVYKAYQPGLDRHVAVKALLPHLADSDDFVRRFRREAQAVADLRHPNIVQVFDFDHDEQSDTYYMVMEYVQGETLKARLARLNRANGRLSPAEVVRFFEGLLAGVDYAHGRGMVHRDLKPANVMFAPGGRTVLTDFGIALIIGGERFTQTGIVMGTPVYMSPEQGLGDSGDERSDLYSLGILLYESLTGQVPFDADTPFGVMQKHLSQPIPALREVSPDFPAQLERVVFRALAKSPGERYQTAGDMWQDLGRARDEYPALQSLSPAEAVALESAPPVSVAAAATPERLRLPTDPSRRPTRKRRIKPLHGWMFAIAALGLLAGGWGYFKVVIPAIVQSRIALGSEQLAAGDFEAAGKSFDSVLGRNPNNVAAMLGRAEAFVAAGQPDVALEEVDRAVEAAPDAPEVYVARGRYRLLYTSGPDVGAAVDDFDAALALKPDYEPALLARGWATLNFQNDAAGALADLREAVRLDDNDPEAHVTLAEALLESGDAQEALPEIQAAVGLKNDDPNYYVDSARIRFALHDSAGGAHDLDSSIQLNPASPDYLAMRAYLHYDAGDYQAALSDADDALSLQPDFAAALYARGLANAGLAKPVDALASLDRVLGHLPFEYDWPFLSIANVREINLDRARVLQTMPGREADTMAAFDAAVTTQPDWFAGYYYRGVFLAQRGNADTARFDLEQALSLAPNQEWRDRIQAALDGLGG